MRRSEGWLRSLSAGTAGGSTKSTEALICFASMNQDADMMKSANMEAMKMVFAEKVGWQAGRIWWRAASTEMCSEHEQIH